MEQNWKRKEYESWDEAFRGLTPIVRQQSVRVAAYTQVLFVKAVKMKYGTNTKAGQERMKGQYADFMYKCGMYHQLGKSLVPPEYQVLQQSFTDEEVAVYKKYTTDGRALVALLQERGANIKDRRKDKSQERPTKNVTWLIMRECCEQHMERWDGSGYPANRLGSDISAPAQIVGLAKELDRLASETRAENPFEMAFDTIIAASGKDWAPELIEVLRAAREDCFAVYNKYITYTRTIPKTVPLVERRSDRSFGLNYRPMTSPEPNIVPVYEANAWFKGVADRPDDTETLDEMRELFVRTNIVDDISWYLMYEAADTVLRMQNCRFAVDGVLLNMMPEFFTATSQLQKFNKLFSDQPIEKSHLMLSVPFESLKGYNKTTLDIIKRYLKNGINIVPDGVNQDERFTPEFLKEMGFTTVVLDSKLYKSIEGAVLVNDLRKNGITVYGKNADSNEILKWLNSNHIYCYSGTMVGIPTSEDEMILNILAREEM
jgi:hypothetical protein